MPGVQSERAPLLEDDDDETHYKTGLSSNQVATRLEHYGRNSVDASRSGPTIPGVIWEELNEPMLRVLLVVALLYSILGSLADALTIFITVLLVIAVEVRTEYNAKSAIKRLSGTISYTVAVLRDSTKTFVSSEDLVPGDILFLSRGQKVPCDGRVLLSMNFSVDESSVTGESIPAKKASAEEGPHSDEETEAAVAKDEVLTGTLVKSGSATVLVQRTGELTHLYASKQKMKKIKQPKTDMQKLMKAVAYWLSIAAGGVSLVVCLLVYFRGGSTIQNAILMGLALAFATVPEELPLIVKAVLAIGALSLSRQRVLVRRLRAAEALGSVDTIISDKTGTLTENVLSVQELVVPGNGATVLQSFPAAQVNEAASKSLVLGWALTCDMQTSESEVPIPLIPDTFDEAMKSFLGLEPGANATSLGASAALSGSTYQTVVDQSPFSPVTRTSSVTRATKDGAKYAQVVKGAHESVLALCNQAQNGTSTVPLPESAGIAFKSQLDRKADAGRLLCYAVRYYDSRTTPQQLENLKYTFLGGVLFADPVLHDAGASIAKLRQAGFRILMATGDSRGTAVAVADAVGIHQGGRVVAGSELAELSDDAWDELEVAARLKPEDKLAMVETLQQQGRRVLMVGDGENDAMSLAAADCGVCIAGGINKSDVAMDAASVVLLAANPKDTSEPTGIALLLPALVEGRKARMNVQKTVIFYLACKMAIVLLFIIAVSVTGDVPLNPIQVVVLEMLMDLGAGSTFTFEGPEGDLLPPRREPIGKLPSIFRNTTFGLLSLGGFLLFTVVGGSFLLARHLFPGDECAAITFAFIAWLAAHVFWGLSCRTLARPVLRKQGLFTNPAFLVWVAVVIILGALVLLVPPVRVQLGLCVIPLEWVGWIVFASFLGLFVPFELAKELHILVVHSHRSAGDQSSVEARA